jgi:hypothetical protein
MNKQHVAAVVLCHDASSARKFWITVHWEVLSDGQYNIYTSYKIGMQDALLGVKTAKE